MTIPPEPESQYIFTKELNVKEDIPFFSYKRNGYYETLGNLRINQGYNSLTWKAIENYLKEELGGNLVYAKCQKAPLSNILNGEAPIPHNQEFIGNSSLENLIEKEAYTTTVPQNSPLIILIYDKEKLEKTKQDTYKIPAQKNLAVKGIIGIENK